MSRMGKTYTVAQFAEAIPGSGGIISTIAKRVGCEWSTARKRIDESAKLLQMVQDERESISDLAESVLVRSIREGDTANAKWWLSRIAKERGFADKQEVELSGKGEDGAIPVRFIDYRTGLEGDDSTDAAG